MERAFSRSCDGGTAQSGAARLARLVVKERRCERDAGATGGEAAENAGGRAGEGRGGFQAWVAAEGRDPWSSFHPARFAVKPRRILHFGD